MKSIINFLKGIVIGIATLVPGVSGGTMAVVLGVYDDLIHSIGSFFENWKKHTLFLLELGLGALLALALFSRILEKAITASPYIMSFLFMGVIIGGLPVLYKKSLSTVSSKRHYLDYVFLFIGFFIVLLMSSEPDAVVSMATAEGLTGLLFLFVAGVIIAIALILPGISGSFMLLALGLYSVTLNAINEVNIPFLIPLGLGLLLGTLGTTKLIETLLSKFPSKTYMLIIGFVIGSLVGVFPGIPNNLTIGILSIAIFTLGFSVMFWIGKKAN